jgi:hypothetical protein
LKNAAIQWKIGEPMSMTILAELEQKAERAAHLEWNLPELKQSDEIYHNPPTLGKLENGK